MLIIFWPMVGTSDAEDFRISFICSHTKYALKARFAHRYGLPADFVNGATYCKTRAMGMIRSFVAAIAFLTATPALAVCVSDLSGAPTVLAFGDSLTAGYGLENGQGFTDVLEDRLRASGLDVPVTNAGVSGDTSTGGRQRLPWTLDGMAKVEIALVIVELGANDALRGIDPAVTRANIDEILEILTKASCRVLLTGMMSPPNLGQEYGAEFGSIYPDMAQKWGVAFYPFFLDGVAAEQDLNQRDGIHPNQAGVQIVVERMLPFVRTALTTSALEE